MSRGQEVFSRLCSRHLELAARLAEVLRRPGLTTVVFILFCEPGGLNVRSLVAAFFGRPATLRPCFASIGVLLFNVPLTVLSRLWTKAITLYR